MKRYALLAICLVTAILGLRAQSLSPEQWRHGVALCAQMSALGSGYGEATAALDKDFPNGFTLDDLNSIYSDRDGWNAVYTNLKQQETTVGDEAALMRLAESTVAGSGNAVDSAMKAFSGGAPMSVEPAADVAAAQDQSAQPAAQQSLALPLACLALALIAMAVALAAMARARKLQAKLDEDAARVAALEQGLENVAAEVQRLGSVAAQAAVAAAVPQPVAAKPRQKSARRESAVQAEQPKAQPSVYYMSRPDSTGYFMRASTEFEAGNSIFVLETTDGVNAVFAVIDDKNVHRLALMMPTENLIGACTGEQIQLSHGKTRVVTDSPGAAVLDGDRWHITRRASIHYE